MNWDHLLQNPFGTGVEELSVDKFQASVYLSSLRIP
jgi:hypothetical protein